MSNFNSIARPYALAAFEFAREHNALESWKHFLATAERIASDAETVKIIANPQVSPAQLVALFRDVLSTAADQFQLHFIQLLAENKRLAALVEITALFNGHCEALEKTSAVRIVTAVETDAAFRKKLAQALTKRVQREVTLACEIDPAILGGAIIYIGDRVIDGSLRGKLTRLLEFSLR